MSTYTHKTETRTPIETVFDWHEKGRVPSLDSALGNGPGKEG